MERQLSSFGAIADTIYRSAHCPLDGVTTNGIVEAERLAGLIWRTSDTLSIATLRSRGVSDDTLRRIMIVEFGSERAVFDAVEPSALVVHGKRVPLADLDAEFK